MRKKLLCQSVKSFYISSMLMKEGAALQLDPGTAVYAYRTGDTVWLLSRKETLVECFQSMQKRDGLIPDGIMDVDSFRCEGGSEITTYDSLDVSLGQARRNSYIAMKCFASYLALGSMFKQLSMEEYQEQADSAADNCEEHMLAYFDREKKRFPALFDGEGTMAIVPVIEGIIYPVFFGKSEAVSADGKHGRLIRALKEHIQTVLVPGICLFEDGGFKLSETSDNSWISKIFLCQYIIEKVLHMNMPQVMDKTDAAHWSWWTEE